MDKLILILLALIGIVLVFKFMKGCIKSVVIMAIVFFIIYVLFKDNVYETISYIVSKVGL